MSSQKKLLALIDQRVASIHQAHLMLANNQRYFTQYKNDHQYNVFFLLIPSFFIGWKLAKWQGNRRGLLKIFDYNLLAALVNLGKISQLLT